MATDSPESESTNIEMVAVDVETLETLVTRAQTEGDEAEQSEDTLQHRTAVERGRAALDASDQIRPMRESTIEMLVGDVKTIRDQLHGPEISMTLDDMEYRLAERVTPEQILESR